MLLNYFKIAYRNLLKNKVFSLINIISLSIGLSASFVIGMIVYYDLSYDKFHTDSDQIYRAVTDFNMPTENFSNSGTPVPLGPELKTRITDIETTAFFYQWSPNKVTAGPNNIESKINDRTIFTESTYFDIFNYNWLAGSKETALNAPNKVVMTLSRAQYFFPALSPDQIIDQTVDYGEVQATITGIVADFEKRSDFVFTEFVSLATANQTGSKRMVIDAGWDTVSSSCQLIVKLKPNVNMGYIDEQLLAISEAHWVEEELAYGMKTYFKLQPLDEIHFDERYGIYDGSRDQANKSVLISLGFIALFLLLLGVINFINLNTANASKRAREIGVRKTLGSSKKQLILQFFGETFLLTLIAGFLSLAVSYWLIQVFEDFIPADLGISMLFQPIMIMGVICLITLVTVLSGFYPAVVMSSFKPSRVLKGHVMVGKSDNRLRKSLTVFQFTIAQVFIIGTLLVGKQIHFIMNKEMGFATESRMFINTPWHINDLNKRTVLAEKLRQIPAIEQISLGSRPPASNSIFADNISIFNGDQEIKAEIQLLYGDHNYLDLYNIDLLAGRLPLNDTIQEYVVNQSASTALGFSDPLEVVNKPFTMYGETFNIVGVMKDFNQRSLKTGVEPLAFTGDASRENYSQFTTIHIKLGKNRDLTETIAQINKAYASIYPDDEISLKFTDEIVAGFYKQEQQLSKLLNWATALSVLISCLGLLGLVVHTTERRVKEIGIRKVLGANILQINKLLCKDFLILIGIAFLIAAPIAYYVMADWLNDFAYRTQISWWIFIASGFSMTLIALLIMSIKITMTASKNPVNSLRSD
jgi:ABC-type antimicrobial peptide transport system permease subunit